MASSNSSLKPFERLLLKIPAKNRLLTRKGLFRILARLFGGLNFSGNGIKVSQHEDGRLHFELEERISECSHAFKLTATASGFTIAPGLVAVSGSSRTPTLLGRPLTDTQSALGPPIFTTSQGIVYVWISAQITPVLGALNVGNVALAYLQTSQWAGSLAPRIEWGTNVPVDVPAQINFETGETAPGTFYTVLARVQRSGDAYSVLEQNWISNIGLSLTGQGSISKQVY